MLRLWTKTQALAAVAGAVMVTVVCFQTELFVRVKLEEVESCVPEAVNHLTTRKALFPLCQAFSVYVVPGVTATWLVVAL